MSAAVDLQPPPRGGIAAMTLSFASDDGALCGLVCQLLDGDGTGSAVALAFADRAPRVLALVRPVPVADPDWRALATAGLRSTIEAPLERWTVAGGGSGGTLELRVEASAPAARPTTIGGLTGTQQPARVTGTVALDGAAPIELDACGQRGSHGGTLDWDALHSLRSVSAWCREGRSVALDSARPAGSGDRNDRDELAATVWEAATALAVEEPRLSTTYDATGHQRRAGLELWLGSPDAPDGETLHPRRAAGHAICGSSLELGALRLDCAFFRWTMEGSTGMGRYDVLRPAMG